MSVSPNDLLSQAKALLSTAKSEVEVRNSIGRAYYASYHVSKQFHEALPALGKAPPQKVGAHQELAHRLLWPNLPTGDPRFQKSRDMGRLLLWLHDKRVRADYFLDLTVQPADATEVVVRAERVFALAN
jgi:hypothetical protein